jgi:hypothetical protein
MSGLSEKIASANEFYIDALPSNQRGELILEQAAQQYSRLVSPVLFILLPLVFLYYQLNRLDYLNGFIPSGPILELFQQMTTSVKVLGFILIALVIWGLILLILLHLDIFGRQVMTLEGTGYRKITTSTDDDGSKTTRYYYVIGGKKFQVQREGFLVFEDGRQYKAYFTPRRKILVNVEALE